MYCVFTLCIHSERLNNYIRYNHSRCKGVHSGSIRYSLRFQSLSFFFFLSTSFWNRSVGIPNGVFLFELLFEESWQKTRRCSSVTTSQLFNPSIADLRSLAWRRGGGGEGGGGQRKGESLDESRKINVRRIKDRSRFFTRNIKAPNATFWISSGHPRSSLLTSLEAWKTRCSNDRGCNSLPRKLASLSSLRPLLLAFHHLARETFLFVPVSPLSRLSGQVFPSNFSTNLRLQRRELPPFPRWTSPTNERKQWKQ